MDNSVINALEAAVNGDPDNAALRVHLAGLLIEADRPQEALEHCTAALSHQPDHVEALRHAATAAEGMGQTDKAESYRRLLGVLDSSTQSDQVPQPEPASAPLEPTPEGQQADYDSETSVSDPDPQKVVPLTVIPGGLSDPIFQEETAPIKLEDVAGMETVKKRLDLAFLAPLRNPDLMKMYGKSLRGGMLLYGPPGCGKTFIARATAGELGARFITVGLSDVLDMYLGQSERNLHELFENARRKAPSVLFFDEIDALGRKRSLMRQSAGRDVVNQLLAELDSVDSKNDSVFVMAATNHPWDVDTALRRPGRFDRMLLVLPPDRPARQTIIERNLNGKPNESIDLEALAAQTESFSGADVVHLCETATEFAMEDSLETGDARPIGMKDFKRAMKEVKPSTGPWFETARNYALFANEGGAYDDLLDHLRKNKLV